jgi:hypothetical protein
MLQHFIIEGRYLGSAERQFSLTRGANPLSEAFLCWSCGECFAKCPIDGRPWNFHRMTCRKCKKMDGLSICPGSLWMSWDHEFTAALPLPVLQWEFERELDYQGLR